MTEPYLDHPLLAVYPNMFGFGYALFNQFNQLKSYGMVTHEKNSQEVYLKRLRSIISVYKPSVILFPAQQGKFNKKRERVQGLLSHMSMLASEMGVHEIIYSRDEIRSAFDKYEAKTKWEIAQQISTFHPNLIDRCLRFRKDYMKEDYYHGIYDALSLIYTYYYRNE